MALALASCALLPGKELTPRASQAESGRTQERKNPGYWGDLGGLSEQEYFSPGRP